MSRVLCVDLGSVRVGLAVSDPSGLLAQPFEVIPRENAEVEIAFRAAHLEVGEIVVGIPYNMDGTPGQAAEEAHGFAQVLRERTGLPVETFDERLSSKQAARAMREGGKSEKQQRGQLDKIAAALVLQAYLDRRRAPGSP